MQISIQTPRKFLNPLLSQKSIVSSDFEEFKVAALKYVQDVQQQRASKQSEPNIVAGALMPFLQSNPLAYNCRPYSQKGQSGIDLAILTGNDINVIIEAKVVGSKDMITVHDLNRKSFHEAIFYFMQERERGNDKLTHIIITDFYAWFVFDAKDFDRLFWRNEQLKKNFHAYHNPNLLTKSTAEVYAAIEAHLPKMLNDLFTEVTIDCAYFNISAPDKIQDKDLTAIYKLLSPDGLIKAFNPNDANSLNREFYNELLYILGLQETKDGGKRLISASSTAGGLYDGIADKLDQQGKPHAFEDVIKLIIIWVNRILFLKLLESQIVTWTGDKKSRFLNIEKISSYDELESLFFDTLARRLPNRKNKSFSYIPYLNSSLFEMQNEENSGIGISALSDSMQIAYYPRTVVKDSAQNCKNGKTKTLSYLFEFLDAYNFANDSSDEVVVETKNLISASVLGLIFEKINGYKDGSFYTPSFVTMYMARQTIQKAILQKFNEKYSWTCTALVGEGGLKNEIKDHHIKKKDSNALIDSLKICDPAVGSGHFLVSALNEILYIKSRLGLLVDEEGTLLDYDITIENDELIVTSDEGELFEYKKGSKEKNLVQKTMFQEKQKIIENCLFGVDINPNSVNICRLRLWIELLKSAYYLPDGTLETLPNIDINIKCGNSLISRFALDTDLKNALKKSKISVKDYRAAVSSYRNTSDKTQKRKLEILINDIKNKFREELQTNDPNLEKLKKVQGALKTLKGQAALFEEDSNKKKEKQKLAANLNADIVKWELAVENAKSNKIYSNSFEWRLEFPEVLDEAGNYDGFDIVIGNPPYFNIDSFGGGSTMLRYLPLNYPQVYMDKSDILFYFLALAGKISKLQTAFIISNAMMYSDKAQKLRNHLLQSSSIEKIINFEKYQVFDEASITSMMLFLNKPHVANSTTQVKNFVEANYDKNKLIREVNSNAGYFNVILEENRVFALAKNDIAALNKKIESSHKTCGDLFHVGKGMETAANEVFCFDHYPVQFDAKYIKKRMSGGVIEKYTYKSALEFILYFEDIPSYEKLDKNIKAHLQSFKAKLENRATVKNEGRVWWRFSRPMHKEYYKYDKLWCSYRAKENIFCLDESTEFIGLTNTTAIFATNPEVCIKYALALLNSKTLNFHYKSIGKQTGNGVFEYFENQVSKLPIPVIGKQAQQPFIAKINSILKAKAKGANTITLERQIDDMVYKLYGLTYDEVKMIEPEYSSMSQKEYEALP
ncbi:Eco57I restriction-modification methylase domain-containing protein [Polaromonas sp. CG_23.6]|uniref:type IIG restriction enzyme/methyltransferase n=1 Tax=Polaromonas sp. CG_23.6 TaxID=2760709 RepID=UPI002474AC32|nr:Eco57I restriction-modification methylase domain-containing protein [Polaromonas sp. CG_23.6]MDH6185307.1 galactitol-specific phosphotransferase system IIB component [Polaromonas sp. CG_23.6]